MTTIAAGASATITVASGGQVAISSNGGLWTTLETPTIGPARASNHGPTAHTRIYGPYVGGATLVITNQSVNTFNYVDYEVGATTLGTIAVGANQTFTLTPQGTLSVSNPSGYWQVVVTPAIGNVSTSVYGPGTGNMVFGPYPAGATVVVTNQTGAALVTSMVTVTNAGSVVTTNALVSNRLQIGTSNQSFTNNTACQRQHTATTQGDISALVFTEVQWSLNASFGITQQGVYSFQKWVEYPQGTFTPVLYSGVATAAMAAGGKQIASDPLAITIPAGATWWEHTVNVTGSATFISTIELPVAAATLGVLDSKYAFSTAPAHQSVGQASTFMFGSAIISGTITGPAAAKSVFIVGDSILWGTGDVTAAGAKQGTGSLDRTLDVAGIGHAKFSIGGMSASDLATIVTAGSAQWVAYIAAIKAVCTHTIFEYGVNDFVLGQTLTQLQASAQTVVGAFSGKINGLSTLSPRTTTTDGYATVANQTVKTDGQWSSAPSYNAAVRALPANFTFYVDFADACMTARDSGIWKSSPQVGFVPTTDGTHPTSAMANYVSANMTITLP